MWVGTGKTPLLVVIQKYALTEFWSFQSYGGPAHVRNTALGDHFFTVVDILLNKMNIHMLFAAGTI